MSEVEKLQQKVNELDMLVRFLLDTNAKLATLVRQNSESIATLSEANNDISAIINTIIRGLEA